VAGVGKSDRRLTRATVLLIPHCLRGGRSGLTRPGRLEKGGQRPPRERIGPTPDGGAERSPARGLGSPLPPHSRHADSPHSVPWLTSAERDRASGARRPLSCCCPCSPSLGGVNTEGYESKILHPSLTPQEHPVSLRGYSAEGGVTRPSVEGPRNPIAGVWGSGRQGGLVIDSPPRTGYEHLPTRCAATLARGHADGFYVVFVFLSQFTSGIAQKLPGLGNECADGSLRLAALGDTRPCSVQSCACPDRVPRARGARGWLSAVASSRQRTRGFSAGGGGR